MSFRLKGHLWSLLDRFTLPPLPGGYFLLSPVFNKDCLPQTSRAFSCVVTNLPLWLVKARN